MVVTHRFLSYLILLIRNAIASFVSLQLSTKKKLKWSHLLFKCIRCGVLVSKSLARACETTIRISVRRAGFFLVVSTG